MGCRLLHQTPLSILLPQKAELAIKLQEQTCMRAVKLLLAA